MVHFLNQPNHPETVEGILTPFNMNAQTHPVVHDYLAAILKRAHRIDQKIILMRSFQAFEAAYGYCTPYFDDASKISEAFLCAATMPYTKRVENEHEAPGAFILAAENPFHADALITAMEIHRKADAMLDGGQIGWEQNFQSHNAPVRMTVELRAVTTAIRVIELQSTPNAQATGSIQKDALTQTLAVARRWNLYLKGHDSAMARHFHGLFGDIETRLNAAQNSASSDNLVTFSPKPPTNG